MSAENEQKYLVYRIGDELYSSPLLSVREVLEYQKPKAMPNMVHYFSGVINVRGAIVGVVDLRKRFGYPDEIGRKAALLLCDTPRGPIAAVVDSVDSVQEFAPAEIEKDPPVKMRVKQDYLLGVAKKGDQIIIVIDLLQSLAEEELKVA